MGYHYVSALPCGEAVGILLGRGGKGAANTLAASIIPPPYVPEVPFITGVQF